MTMFAMLALLLLVAADPEAAEPEAIVPTVVAPELAERRAIEAAVVAIFRPYADGPAVPPAWEAPIYSAETAALIAEWHAVAPQDEPDDLSDGDSLCQCQERDQQAFTATITSVDRESANLAEVAVTIDLGFPAAARSARRERLVLKREDGAWKLDDLMAESFAAGLKQALRETIAADRARATGERG